MKVVKDKEFLNKPCKEVRVWDEKEMAHANKVITHIKTFLIQYKEQAVGVASNQLGYDVRIFGARINNVIKIYINPVIHTYQHSGRYPSVESCLSCKERDIRISRDNKIFLNHDVLIDCKRTSISEKYEGYNASIIQHEVDHLDGILIIDSTRKIHSVIAKKRINNK